MTSRAKPILIVVLALAILAVLGTLWARAIGLLQPGEVAPILGLNTVVLLAVVLWVGRRRASAKE